MSKFGDIIDAKIPILLNFYSDLDESSAEMHAVLRDVAAAMGEIAFKIFSLSSAVPAYNAADALSSSIATNAAAKARRTRHDPLGALRVLFLCHRSPVWIFSPLLWLTV